MWTVYGLITIALQPGIIQIIDQKEFENPQDCFTEAMVLMQDAEDPRGMVCTPIPDDRKTGV
jgi:hypothetical protein